MPEDPSLDAAANPSHSDGGANGVPPSADRDAMTRDVVMLRARCSNLRHWCRLMLEDPAAAGVLPEATAAELRATAPDVTEPEGQTVVALLARGGNVPPAHPLAPAATDSASLRAAASRLTAECERLRQAFFSLYDHLHPDDNLTDEYFLEQRAAGPMRPMSEVLAEIEREFGGQP